MKFSTCLSFALSTEKRRWHLYFCAWQHWGAVLHQRVQDEDEAWGATSCWDLSLLRPHFNVLPPGTLCPFASPSLGHGSQLSPKSAHQGPPPSVRSSTNNIDIIYPCLPTPESWCFLMAQFHPAGLCDFPGSFKETFTNSDNTVAESGCLKAHKFFLTSWTLWVSRRHFIRGCAKEKSVICPEPNSLLLFPTLLLVWMKCSWGSTNQAMLPVTYKYLLYTSIYKVLHKWWICQKTKKNLSPNQTKENKIIAICFVISLLCTDLPQSGVGLFDLHHTLRPSSLSMITG